MLGARVTFTGAHGRVEGVIVAVYRYNGVEYALVRDASGGYHGYAMEVTQ